MKKTFLPVMAVAVILAASCMKSGDKASENEFSFHLSDSLADPEASMLYDNLGRLSGHSILVGHQDAPAYGMGWKGDEFRTDINDVCGDFPAVFGWDLGHIGQDFNIDSVPFDRMRQWAVAAYKRSGINTYSWHSLNMVSGGSAWDTASCVPGILPGGDHHDTFLARLDLVAEFLASLKNEHGKPIPVLFRPWHEMNGGWFWWGRTACTPDQYKRLYRFTVDYLRSEKHFHQVIFVYSPGGFSSAEEYMRYYPGDEWVDVMGVDDYTGLNNRDNTHMTVSMLETMDSLASAHSKLFAITETGVETLPDSTWFTGVLLPTIKKNPSTMNTAWVLFWRNGRPDHFYAPFPGHPSAADFIKFEEDPVTLFLSDIKGIYNAPAE